MTARTIILQSLDQGVILTFKSHGLQKTVLKAIVAINSDPYNRSGQIKLKTFWEFPSGPTVRTHHFHCWGLVSISGPGIKIL